MGKAIQFWVVSCILLFILSQILDWVQQTPLPFPILVAAGFGLALGSNANKRPLQSLGLKLLFPPKS
jgi:hypothetical protein